MDTKKVTCYGCLKSYPISVSLIRRIENNELPTNTYCAITKQKEEFILEDQSPSNNPMFNSTYLDNIAKLVHKLIVRNNAVRS